MPNLPAALADYPLGPKHNGKGHRYYLKGWEIDFAEWYTRQPIRPSLKEQLEKAQELTQTLIGEKYIIGLKQRPLYKELVTKLNTDQVSRSKALLERRYPRAVEAHFQALEMAMGEKDYKAVPAFTVPILDRVVPKKQEGATITAIQITLQAGQAEALDAEFVDITAVKLPGNPNG